MVKGLHIEPTNMCALKCPKCARTEFIEQFGQDKWQNKNLNLADLKQFLDIDLNGVEVLLCGIYGDPIYYSDLFEMLRYFKSAGAYIVLATNGSYKTQEWWVELVRILDCNDSVVFGIDGTPDNFKQYRINADWPSIQLGIETLNKTDIKLVWQYIPFSFNEQDINSARQLAKDLKFNDFDILHSDRWDHNDPLMPTNKALTVEHSIIWKNSGTKDYKLEPKCSDNKQHYISADGFYTPCCYAGDYRFYYKSEFYKNRAQYAISNTTLGQILDSEHSKNFYNSLEEAKLNYCTYSCPKL